MPLRITSQHIALILMVAGVVSLVLHEPLAKLDTLLVKSGPHGLDQARHRLARRMVLGVGAVLVALALALVVR